MSTLGDYLRQADIPPRHATAVLADDDRGQAWRDKALGLIARLGQGGIVCLHGSRGGGKTQMAAQMAKAMCRREAQQPDGGHRFPALYVRAMEIYMAIKATYTRDAGETEAEVVHRYCRPLLLIIDEAHEKPDSAWAMSLLTLIVDKRYAEGRKDTVIIANAQTAQEMAALVGPSIASRAVETGGMVDCGVWGSFRG